MSAVVWCPACGHGPLISHANGLVPQHCWPGAFVACVGIAQVGLQGVA